MVDPNMRVLPSHRFGYGIREREERNHSAEEQAIERQKGPYHDKTIDELRLLIQQRAPLDQREEDVGDDTGRMDSRK